MIKRFFFLVVTAAFISSFLLLAGTAVLDRVNAARTDSQLQALRLASSSASQDEASDASRQQPVSIATEPVLEEPATRTIGEVLADPQAFRDQYVTLTGSAVMGENNSLVISDGTGDIRVGIDSASIPMNSGEKLTVTGLLSLSSESTDLAACRIVNAQGMVIQLNSCETDSLANINNFAISENNTPGEQSASGEQPAPAENATTIADLISNPSAYYNQLLTVTGMVTLLDDHEFLLNDGTGQIFVDVEDHLYGSLPLTNGQMITVSGYFENDGQYLDIDACEIIDESGQSTLTSDCGTGDDDHATNSNENTAYNDDDHSANSNDNTAYSDDNHNDDSNDNSAYDDHSDDGDNQSDEEDDGDHSNNANDDDHEDDDDHDDEHDDEHDDDHDDNDNGDHEDGGD